MKYFEMSRSYSCAESHKCVSPRCPSKKKKKMKGGLDHSVSGCNALFSIKKDCVFGEGARFMSGIQ